MMINCGSCPLGPGVPRSSSCSRRVRPEPSRKMWAVDWPTMRLPPLRVCTCSVSESAEKAAPLTITRSKFVSGVTKLRVSMRPGPPMSGTGVSATGVGNSTCIVLELEPVTGRLGGFTERPLCACAVIRPITANEKTRINARLVSRFTLPKIIFQNLLTPNETHRARGGDKAGVVNIVPRFFLHHYGFDEVNDFSARSSVTNHIAQ